MKSPKQKSPKSEIPDNIWPGSFYRYPSKNSAGDLKDTDSERKDDEKEDGEIIL